jgi:hypothetical protein
MENLIAPFPFHILRILENLIALRQDGIGRVITNMLIVTSFAPRSWSCSFLVCTVHAHDRRHSGSYMTVDTLLVDGLPVRELGNPGLTTPGYVNNMSEREREREKTLP